MHYYTNINSDELIKMGTPNLVHGTFTEKPPGVRIQAGAGGATSASKYYHKGNLIPITEENNP